MNYDFEILLGIPEVKEYIDNLKLESDKEKPNSNKLKTLKKISKVFKLLSLNPRHPSLNTHEIVALTNRYNHKVFESYAKNNVPSALRVFWVYGPNTRQITIISIEPHPNDKNNAYKRIILSSLPYN